MIRNVQREFSFIDRLGNERRVEIGVRVVLRYEVAGQNDMLLPTEISTVWVDGIEISWLPVFNKAQANGWLDQAIRDFINDETTHWKKAA